MKNISYGWWLEYLSMHRLKGRGRKAKLGNEGSECTPGVKGKIILKKGQNRGVFFLHKVLYILCHLCSNSKSTDSSHLYASKNIVFYLLMKDVLMDGCTPEPEPHASPSLWFNNEQNGIKPNWNSLGAGKVTSWHCMKLKTAQLTGDSVHLLVNSACKNVSSFVHFILKNSVVYKQQIPKGLIGKWGKQTTDYAIRLPGVIQKAYRTMMLAFYLGSILPCACFLMTAHRPNGGC